MSNNQLSESLHHLVKAFVVSKGMLEAFAMQMNKAEEAQRAIALARAEFYVGYYQAKLGKACFFGSWYWSRKLKKAKRNLENLLKQYKTNNFVV